MIFNKVEITVCDLYDFNCSLITYGIVTGKELREEILRVSGRDTTSSPIVFDKRLINDDDVFEPDASQPYIILDGDLEAEKMALDATLFDFNYEIPPRFSSFSQKKKRNNAIDVNELDSNFNSMFFQLLMRQHSSPSGPSPSSYADNAAAIAALGSMRNNEIDTDSDENPDYDIPESLNSTDDDDDDDDDDEDFLRYDEGMYDIMDNSPRQRFLEFHIRQQMTNNNNNNMNHQFITFIQPNNQNHYMANINPNRYLANINQLNQLNQLNQFNQLRRNDNNVLILTRNEQDAVRRIAIENPQFDRLTIFQVYEACGRDENTTVQCLSTM